MARPTVSTGRAASTALVLCLLGTVPLAAARDGSPVGAPRAAGATPRESTPEAAGAVRARLERARDDLVNLRFEEALAELGDLLAADGLSGSERADALILRCQTQIAVGDLGAAERDYREILGLRPDWVPDAAATPPKAAERLAKLRARTIGRLVLRVEPADGRVAVDDRGLALDAGGAAALVAGDHLLRVEREGFDPIERPLTIVAGEDLVLELRLVPNARTVVIRTEPDGVEVVVDGVVRGRTERPPDATGPRWVAAPAELRIDHLALGEHTFELRKPCFRSERLRDLLAVDLLDAGEKRYEVIRLQPVRGTLRLRGGPPGAGVLIDGEPAGVLPLEGSALCPGDHRVEVSHGGRRIWISDESLVADSERVLEIVPRPNVVLLGAPSWPERLRGFERFSRLDLAPAPEIVGDPTDPRSWSRLDVPRDVDIVAARGAEGGPREEWLLYSPLLEVVARADAPPECGSPAWTRVVWGLHLADSEVGGPARVVEVVRGGPAAGSGLAVGDRLLTVGGIRAESALAARRVLAVATPASPLELVWLTPAGESRSGSIRGALSPALRVEAPDPVDAVLRAAWAAVHAASLPPEQAGSAFANLALLQLAHGRAAAAIDTWSKLRWPDGGGIASGTASYHLAVALQRAGRTEEAVAALRAAARSAATAFDDEGPPVAPAARDRLAMREAAGR